MNPRYESEAELMTALQVAAEERLFPQTPDLSEVVASRLTDTVRTAGQPQPAARWSRTRLIPAAALLLAIIVGSFVSPALRQAAADFLGISGIRIEFEEQVPEPTILLPELGEESSLDAARTKAGFPIRVPGLLGPPDRVYIDDAIPGGLVSLVYDPRPGLPQAAETGVGLLVTEFRGRAPEEFLKKVAGNETSIKLVEIDGETAYWVSGAPHSLAARDAEGGFQDGMVRLATNVLLFEQAGVAYRLEGGITMSRALAIARSI